MHNIGVHGVQKRGETGVIATSRGRVRVEDRAGMWSNGKRKVEIKMIICY